MVLAGGGFTVYRALDAEGDLARDGRTVLGIVGPISAAPTQQWSVSAAELVGPEAACEESPSSFAPCSAWVQDAGPDKPLLARVTISATTDGETRWTSHTVGLDRNSGKRLWESPQTWDDINCQTAQTGLALCAFTKDEQVTASWVDVSTGLLGATVKAQQQGQVSVQVLDTDGYLVMSEWNGDSTPGTATIRKIDPAGTVAWMWSASATVSNIPRLLRWEGQLFIADGTYGGRPIILDDSTGMAVSDAAAAESTGQAIVGLHQGEPVVRDENEVLRIGGRQIGAPKESLEPFRIDDGRDGAPLITSSGGSYYVSGTVLTARDPDQPEKQLWSKQNADAPIWCGGSLVINVRHGDSSGSAGSPDLRLTAVDAVTGSVRWESAGTDEPWPSSYCDGSTLVTNNGDVLEARDLATGRVMWTGPTGTGTRPYFTAARPDESRMIVQDGAQITSLTW